MKRIQNTSHDGGKWDVGIFTNCNSASSHSKAIENMTTAYLALADEVPALVPPQSRDDHNKWTFEDF